MFQLGLIKQETHEFSAIFSVIVLVFYCLVSTLFQQKELKYHTTKDEINTFMDEN